MKKDCIIIGMGKLGINIAKELNRLGENVTVIDKNPSKLSRMEDFSGFMVNDDATDMMVLEQNGIRTAQKVIITTDSDNTNVFLAHVCLNIYNVPEIFIRLSDTDKNSLVENTRIKVINPFSLCMDYFNDLLEEK